MAGESIIRGAQLYVDRLNDEGGIEGKKLELEVYDDQNDPQVAVEVAHEIVASDALAVIGHYSSDTALAAGKIYQAYGIPAVTGSATADEVTTWNNWYFRTVFSNSNQGLSIANYINKILERSRISIVYSTDSYGSTLANNTAQAFTDLGREVVNRWLIKTEADRDTIVDELVAMQEQGEDPGVIVVSAGRQLAVNLIAKIKLYELDYTIFGGDALADIAIAQRFNNTPEERDNPGFYTNDVYALTPVVLDISDEVGQEFKNLYEENYNSVPGWTAVTYYDAVHVLVEAIAKSFEQPEQLLPKAIAKNNWRESRYLVISEGGEAQLLTFNLSKPAPVGGLTVNINIDDLDGEGADTEFPPELISNIVDFGQIEEDGVITASLTIAEGETEATFGISAIADDLDEGSETYSLTLLPDETYTADSNSTTITTTIEDNMTSPTVSLTPETLIATEGETFAWNFSLDTPAPEGGLSLFLPITVNNDPAHQEMWNTTSTVVTSTVEIT